MGQLIEIIKNARQISLQANFRSQFFNLSQRHKIRDIYIYIYIYI